MNQLEKIKKLKQEISYLRNDKEHYKNLSKEFLNQIEDVEKKLNVALDRLRIISVKSYYTNECSECDSEILRATKTASYGLEKISKMRDRR